MSHNPSKNPKEDAVTRETAMDKALVFLRHATYESVDEDSIASALISIAWMMLADRLPSED